MHVGTSKGLGGPYHEFTWMALGNHHINLAEKNVVMLSNGNPLAMFQPKHMRANYEPYLLRQESNFCLPTKVACHIAFHVPSPKRNLGCLRL